jgi:hypothetical protein
MPAPRLNAGRPLCPCQAVRMRKAFKRLKGYTGRVMRDLRRHLGDIAASALRERVLAGPRLAPAAQRWRQNLCAARARGRLHLKGQGAGALRVWLQGQHCNHIG